VHVHIVGDVVVVGIDVVVVDIVVVVVVVVVVVDSTRKYHTCTSTLQLGHLADRQIHKNN